MIFYDCVDLQYNILVWALVKKQWEWIYFGICSELWQWNKLVVRRLVLVWHISTKKDISACVWQQCTDNKHVISSSLWKMESVCEEQYVVLKFCVHLQKSIHSIMKQGGLGGLAVYVNKIMINRCCHCSGRLNNSGWNSGHITYILW